MQRFTMMVGLPGSGKSTYVNFLLQLSEDLLVVSSDNIRIEFGYEPDEIKDVFTIAEDRIINGLKEGKSVVFDATNLRRKRRMQLLNKIHSLNRYVECECVVRAIPIKVCKYFNSLRRGRAQVPDYAINRMVRSFEIPMKGEGFNEVVFYDTYDIVEYGKAIDFLDENDFLLKDFTSIDLDDMLGFDQDNPHHTLTLYNHSIACELYVRKHDKYFDSQDRKNIELAARYHDIGKILTKDYHDSHGNISETAHYYGHENVGAYLMLTELPFMEQSYIPVAQAIEIASYINFHMRVSFTWKDSPYGKTTVKEKSMFSAKEIMMLELLGEGDRQAH